MAGFDVTLEAGAVGTRADLVERVPLWVPQEHLPGVKRPERLDRLRRQVA